MQNTIEKIKTFLPVFNGFYESIWQFDDDMVLYNINEDRQEKGLSEIDFDNLEINNAEYEKDVSIAFCEVLEKELSDYVKSITFENLYSPKQYNFSTDSINCEIEPDADAISAFIYKNKDAFCEYLKENYTGCDGFIPSYSNAFDVWANNTLGFKSFNCNGHYLGSILQFICNILDINDLYEAVKSEIYEGDYILNWDDCINKPICQECKAFIKDADILKDIEKYHTVTGKNPATILCAGCIENR